MSEFESAPIPSKREGYGFFPRVFEEARRLAPQGRAVVLDAAEHNYASIRANLYGSRYRRAGEKRHATQRDGKIYFWITLEPVS